MLIKIGSRPKVPTDSDRHSHQIAIVHAIAQVIRECIDADETRVWRIRKRAVRSAEVRDTTVGWIVYDRRRQRVAFGVPIIVEQRGVPLFRQLKTGRPRRSHRRRNLLRL